MNHPLATDTPQGHYTNVAKKIMAAPQRVWKSASASGSATRNATLLFKANGPGSSSKCHFIIFYPYRCV